MMVSPLKEKRNKWMKILSFFKKNSNMLVDLIPGEDPQPTIFGTSKRVLTRPKSHARFRPYSVTSNTRSKLAVIFLILIPYSHLIG